MKATNNDTVIFKDGTEVSAHHGLISINEDLEVKQGYDGNFVYDFGDAPELFTYESPSKVVAFTHQHRAELADYMIKLWTKFKNKK